jgi:FMN reductase
MCEHQTRTAALVSALGTAIANRVHVSRFDLSVATLAQLILGTLTRDALSAEGLAVVEQIETADILVVGSPIYRASYTGALKHLFDIVHYRALTGAVGVIAATGGSTFHALATEHQFRPLPGFFGIISVPTTIYTLETDFEGTVLTQTASLCLASRTAAQHPASDGLIQDKRSTTTRKKQ